METLVNRVAESGLITISLEKYFPKNDFEIFDIKSYLFQGLILKEKDFREAMQNIDWNTYQDKIVLVINTADAIIPLWAYMLITKYLGGIAHDVFCGTKMDYLSQYYKHIIESIDPEDYIDKRLVIKGCADVELPPQAYVSIVQRLMLHAQSIMFGEPCSTVPIFKRPRNIVK
ncbi:MAG: DUF2480 family protein [Saprospiraceae bacterium]